MSEKDPLTRKEQLQIEGYKALMQYGCQMSADHISTDRVMIPLSLAPALWVLAPPNGPINSKVAQSLILLGGVVFIWSWMRRNSRSERRLSAIWDILREIERQLGFEAYLILKRFMGAWLFQPRRFRKGRFRIQKPPKREFQLKEQFGWTAIVFYGVVLVYVWWENIASWLCF